MNSLWNSYKKKTVYEELKKNIEVDILIIGGGITGLSTLFYLQNSNFKIALVERNMIGEAITSKSTAKITFLQENIYSKLKKFHNENISKLYLDSQLWAINEITSIINNYNIDCDFEMSSSYLYTNQSNNIKAIDKERELLNKFNIATDIVNKLPDNEPCKYAIKVNNTYTFNPIKYLNSLNNIINDKNINIYENTIIMSINKENEYYIANTINNTIKTKYVVINSHYPNFLFPYLFPFKVTLEKSYISAEKVNNNFNFNAISLDKPVKSIRYYQDKEKIYKIILSNSHNIAIKQDEAKNFNDNKGNYIWSNIDIKTNDHLPLIGLIDHNFLIGTGYNTWGMTNSLLAGKIISDIILNKDNKYIFLFNPKRGVNLGNIINFPISLCSNMYAYINSKINNNKHWYKNNIKFETRNNKRVAIFKDDNNKNHIVYNTCPHLKCNLIFNEVELTWDCPCHGSRFDLDGKCIEGPSNYDISYNENIDESL